MQQICADLTAEHDALDAVVAGLDESGWRWPTPADGWAVADTIVHIAFFDEMGLLAATDTEEFERRKGALMAGEVDFEAMAQARSGAELLSWWREVRVPMVDGLAVLDPKERLPWFGPPMSARSFATARLMETWSHGSDVETALGEPIPATDRLRHIAHLGVVTRGWSYVNRGMTPDETPVYVELQGPSGDLWTWGPDDAVHRVSGPALDFCLVVTQRRPLDAVALKVEGSAAQEWMSIAQAFAGPPTQTDSGRAALGGPR